MDASSITYQRRATNEVVIGGVAMGGDQPVRVQTMCNTPTQDVAACVAQCKRVADAGADYVRLTTQGLPEVTALAEIKRQLRCNGYAIPLIADVHFNAAVALAAAAVADKVRINPGNFARTAEDSEKKLVELLAVCRQYQTALRIGVNHGSLADRITEQHGDTPQGMVVAAMEMLRICRRENFSQVVVSMKSSNTRVMAAAYRLLVAQMDAERMRYPLHLGVTEVGDGEEGRLKSAVGIGSLLLDGIGDTIRVSLTEPPENEIPVALSILQAARVRFTKPEYIACPGCGRTLFDLQKTLAAVREAPAHLAGVRIAVMGCIVNGPGEMADADFGYVGAGAGKITLYRGKEVVKKNIPESQAVQELLALIANC
jgi:(E)-4-hydroxy-3-methylbut-2-enyl-diphosphate synthase